MQALSKATPGETYTIQWMFGQPEVLDFLHSHSVDEGERIQLIQKMRDCVIIGAKDSRFAMGNCRPNTGVGKSYKRGKIFCGLSA